MKYLILTLFLIVGTKNELSAQYYFKHFTVENGLSNNIVFCSVQDRKGFMWFGTRDGLNRFDGYRFKTFRYEEGNPKSLGSNYILATYVDPKGTLWIGTTNGLYSYNEKTEDFSLLEVTRNSSIADIKLDTRANLWFISGLTLQRYNIRSKKLRSYLSGRPFNATSICIANDNLWVATGDGDIKKYLPETDSFTEFNLFGNSKPTSSQWIKKIFNSGKNSLLVGTSNQGVKLFDIASQTYKDILTYNADGTEIYARDFIAHRDNDYWIATESGIYIYNLVSDKVTHLKKQHNDLLSISDNAVYTLCKDKEGGIWAGTYFGGVNYCPASLLPIKKYYPQHGSNAISGNAVREICRDDRGNLWIGTEDAGLNKLNTRTGKFTYFRPGTGKNTISYYNVHGLLANGNDLWLGTFEHGLDVLDINTGWVKRRYTWDTGSNTSRNNFVISIYKTSAGDILAGTGFGLYKHNKKRDRFEVVKSIPQDNFIYCIFEDRTGVIWAGTLSNGVYFYNPRNGARGNLRFEEQNQNSLGSNAVNSVFEDSSSNLWFATEGGGLCKLNRSDNSFRRYTTRDGFPSNIIFKVLEDSRRRLWISSSRGLICFNPKTEDLKVYTRADGLLTDQFNYNSGFKDRDGRMYFGSVKGMISFNPDRFVANNFVPPVYITGFQVYNRELEIDHKDSPLTESLTSTKEIKLPYNQSTFSIDFAALSYAAPEVNEYAYKLEGLDKEWNRLKTNRKIYYTNVPPGSYTLFVKGSNSSGTWNHQPTSLVIEILPPFWATTWAYLIYALAAAAAIFYAVRGYHRRTEERNQRKMDAFRLEKEREISFLENEREREIYKAKIDFFTNVTHEIRTPLTLIKAPLEKVLKKAGTSEEIKEDLEIMRRNTGHLLDLTNQLLDFRKTETTGFRLSFVKADVSEVLTETFLRFKPAAEEKKLAYELLVPAEAQWAYIDIAALTKILSNLFSNAIKYADTQVQVHMRTTDRDMFTIHVVNDGALIPASLRDKIFEPFVRLVEAESQAGTGIGLPLARSLAELHKGQVFADHRDGMNLFVLELPVHQEIEFHLEETSAADQPLSSGEQQAECHISRPIVLLVEDHREILDFIARELMFDYIVLKAQHGLEALEMLEASPVNLIVSDVMMPVMDGFELCRRIKSNIEYSHIPVILLTAKNTLDSKIAGLELGADSYIEKPFSPEHLNVQIASLLINRSNVKEYFARNPLANIKSIAYTRADESFLSKLNEVIQQNMADVNLSIDFLANSMNMSRPTFFRKIKAISDLSPNDLIKIARLKKAAELLAEGNYKVYEVCDMVGYSSQAYFSKTFLAQFGMTPSEYARNKSAVN